ncbi:hypothetical protein OH492_21950 [Vibrio chagasii]|nr:hypothetical protein [Vibrio chagasii]
MNCISLSRCFDKDEQASRKFVTIVNQTPVKRRKEALCRHQHKQHHPLNDFVEYPPQEMAARALHNLEQLQRRHSPGASLIALRSATHEHCI